MGGAGPPPRFRPLRVLRVVIADDDAAARQGLGMLLRAAGDIDLVGDASNGLEAIALVERLHPDVLVIDLGMPEMGGLEATRRLSESGTATRVLVLTILSSEETVYEALSAGASGFLLKDSAHDLLALAVRVVADGDALVDPRLTYRLISRASRARADSIEAGRRLADLSERETDVLRLLARGLSNAEIADALMVSESTVKTHVSRILAKLELRDRVQAVILAFQAGLDP